MFTALLLAVTWRFDRSLLFLPQSPVLPVKKAGDSVDVKSVFADSSQVAAGATLRRSSGEKLNLNGELSLNKSQWRFSIAPIDDSQSAAFGFSRDGQSKLKAYEKENGHLPEVWLQFNLIRKSTFSCGYSVVNRNGSFVHLTAHRLKWAVNLVIPDAPGEYLIYCQLTSQDQRHLAFPHLQSPTDGFLFARRLSVSSK